MLTGLINLHRLVVSKSRLNAALPRQHSVFAINWHSVVPAKARLAFLTGCPWLLPGSRPAVQLTMEGTSTEGAFFIGVNRPPTRFRFLGAAEINTTPERSSQKLSGQNNAKLFYSRYVPRKFVTDCQFAYQWFDFLDLFDSLNF